MSSPKLITRRKATLGISLVLAAALGGCFRPVYGPTATGAPVEAAMAAIEVGAISTSAARQEFGHTLRSELVFAMDGSGASQAARRYELTATVTDSLTSPLVSSTTGRAVSGTITAVANWQVTDRESGQIVYRGTANGAASYERTVQRFASLRAQRDAETRLAKQLSEQIAQRLAIDIRAARRDI